MHPDIVQKYLFDRGSFFRSALRMLENQPSDYDPSRPAQGLVLPMLFEVVQENLPRHIQQYLRCYQAIDSYLDLFHRTDYLFLLGGFLGWGRDSYVRIDVTTNPEKVARRIEQSENFSVSGDHISILPKDVLVCSVETKKSPFQLRDWQLDSSKVDMLGTRIAAMLMAQYKIKSKDGRGYT